MDGLGHRGASTASDVVGVPRVGSIRAATEGTMHVHGVPQSGQSMTNCENYQSGEGFSESLNFVADSRAC
jgi:hypothetical protein